MHGKITDVFEDKRRTYYKIWWKNGKVSDEIKSSLWLSTEPVESSDSEDEEEDNEMPQLIVDSDDDSDVESIADSDLVDFFENPTSSKF